MKKLRLLLNEDCNRNCKRCCNKDFDLKNLEVAKDYNQYDEIYLTGGEPLLHTINVINIICNLRNISTETKIFLYTAKIDNVYDVIGVLNILNGITITLHEKEDVERFLFLNEFLEIYLEDYKNKSLRLNIFKGFDISKIENMKNKLNWKIKKDIVWIENCPLPKDEEFKRYR